VLLGREVAERVVGRQLIAPRVTRRQVYPVPLSSDTNSRPGFDARRSTTEGTGVKQPTYTRCVRPVAAAVAKVHVAVYRVTGGRLGHRWRGGEIGLLATTGRRSGRRRTTPLVCLRDGTNIVVVAPNGGSDRTPEWWLNLQRRPHAELELGGEAHQVIAEQATAEVYIRLTARFCDAFPCFGRYCARTERVLPVIVLRPLSPHCTAP
jgi:deazaflavin-dependent oxidoreductase (nitroreductase family)